MEGAMLLVNLVGGMLLLAIGAGVRIFRAGGLVAGYNTMPREEQDKIDVERMTRYVGNMLMVAAGILLVFGLASLVLDLPASALWLSWGLFLVPIVAGLVYINTGDRLRKR
jgi:hypothetical protein